MIDGTLDALTRAHMQDSLMEIKNELNNTVIMIIHDVKLERPRDRLSLAKDVEYNRLRSEVLTFLYEKQRKVEYISTKAASPTSTAKKSVSAI